MKNPLLVTLCLLAAPFVLCGQTRISLSGSTANSQENSLARRIQAAGSAAPQGANAIPAIAGPTLGFVFDRQASAVRRVPGIIGAASIGDPIQAGLTFARAYTAPQQDYIVGITARAFAVTLVSLSHGAVSGTTALDILPPAPDRIAFSPSGDSIALYYKSTQRLIALGGVPGAPQVISSWDVTAYAGDLTALAIADGGSAVLAGVTQGSAGVLVLFRKDGPSSVILPMSRPAAAQFLWESTDAVVADRAQGTVDFLKDVTGTMEVRLLSDAAHGLATPDLVAVDRSGRTVVVAESGTSAGLSIDLASAVIQPFDCGCSISTLEPLNGDIAYRITDLGGGKFTMLDGRGTSPVFETVSQPQTPATCGVRERLPRATPRGPFAPAIAGLDGCGLPANREVIQ